MISSAVERFVHIEDVGSSSLSSPTTHFDSGDGARCSSWRMGGGGPATDPPEFGARRDGRLTTHALREGLGRVISSAVERFVHIEDVGSSSLSSPTTHFDSGDGARCSSWRMGGGGPATDPPEFGARRDGRLTTHALREGLGRVISSAVERFVYTEDVGSSSLSSPTTSPVNSYPNPSSGPFGPAQGHPTVIRRRAHRSGVARQAGNSGLTE